MKQPRIENDGGVEADPWTTDNLVPVFRNAVTHVTIPQQLPPKRRS
jgi:hypothetical protein